VGNERLASSRLSYPPFFAGKEPLGSEPLVGVGHLRLSSFPLESLVLEPIVLAIGKATKQGYE